MFGDNKLNVRKASRKSIVVVPHYDDEILCAISFLLAYPNEIDLYFTHQDDFITKEEEHKQSEMLHKCLSIINNYRGVCGYPAVMSFSCDTTDDLLTKNALMNACTMPIEYFVTTGPSIHESHVKCFEWCRQLLRFPYIQNIKTFMAAQYPQNWYSIGEQATTYVRIDGDVLKTVVKNCFDCYADKIKQNEFFGYEAFKLGLKFFGMRTKFDYAQPFTILHQQLYVTGD